MDISNITEKSFENRDSLRAEVERALTGANIERDEPAGFQTEGVFFGSQPPKMRIDQYLEASTGWVYGCVNRIAQSISAIDLRLYQIKGDQIEEVDSHPSIDLLDQVNDYTTKIDHFHLTQEYLELTGEAPWYLNRGESGKQEPTSMMLLRPDRLTIIQSTDKNSSNPIKEYRYRADANNEITISIDELIFLKYPDATNYFRGKGTLQAAAKVVDIDNFSEDYNKRFFYNSARPDMVLSSEQKLTSTQRQTLQGSIRKLYQGGDKAHKTLILESGLKAAPYSLSQKDMDFLAQQNFDMSKIFSIFGVPKSVMSVSDDVNLANAKVGEYIFMKYTIVPKLKRIVAQLNEFYLPMFKGTENMFFSFDNPIPQDTDALIRKYDSALLQGWMTRNEIRAEENLEDAGEEADRLFIPFGISPIDDRSRPDAETLSIKVKPKKNFKTVIQNSAGGYSLAKKNYSAETKHKAEIDAKIKDINRSVDKIAYSMVKNLVKSKIDKQNALKAQKKNLFFEYGGIFLASVKNYERAFAIGTTTIFEEQKKKILARVPKKDISVDDWLLDEEEEAKTMVRVFTPLTKRIIKDAGTKAALLVSADGSFDDLTKTVQDYVKNRTFEFSFEVNQETNKKLAKTLADGIAKGEGIPALRNRVSSLFKDMENYRSERIARTEVVQASNFAATQAYEQSGVVKEVQWLTTEDDRADEDCLDLDGKTITLGDSFGSSDYFGEVEYPPIHANCRCTVVPIVS